MLQSATFSLLTSKAYAIETLTDGTWIEVTALTESEISEQVIGVQEGNANFDAWSSLHWEESMGWRGQTQSALWEDG